MGHLSARYHTLKQQWKLGFSFDITQSSLNVPKDFLFIKSQNDAQQSKITFDFSRDFYDRKRHTEVKGSVAYVTSNLRQTLQSEGTSRSENGVEFTFVASFEPRILLNKEKQEVSQVSSVNALEVLALYFTVYAQSNYYFGVKYLPVQFGYRSFVPLNSSTNLTDQSVWLRFSTRLGEKKSISYSASGGRTEKTEASSFPL